MAKRAGPPAQTHSWDLWDVKDKTKKVIIANFPEQQEVSVGRIASCTFVMDADKVNVSRKHCVLRWANMKNCVEIEDLSSYGTFIDHKKLGKGNRLLLKGGEVISNLDDYITADFMYSVKHNIQHQTPANKMAKMSKAPTALHSAPMPDKVNVPAIPPTVPSPDSVVEDSMPDAEHDAPHRAAVRAASRTSLDDMFSSADSSGLAEGVALCHSQSEQSQALGKGSGWSEQSSRHKQQASDTNQSQSSMAPPSASFQFGRTSRASLKRKQTKLTDVFGGNSKSVSAINEAEHESRNTTDKSRPLEITNNIVQPSNNNMEEAERDSADSEVAELFACGAVPPPAKRPLLLNQTSNRSGNVQTAKPRTSQRTLTSASSVSRPMSVKSTALSIDAEVAFARAVEDEEDQIVRSLVPDSLPLPGPDDYNTTPAKEVLWLAKTNRESKGLDMGQVEEIELEDDDAVPLIQHLNTAQLLWIQDNVKLMDITVKVNETSTTTAAAKHMDDLPNYKTFKKTTPVPNVRVLGAADYVDHTKVGAHGQILASQHHDSDQMLID